MRNILAVSLMLAATPAAAQLSAADEQLCTEISKTSETIMTARQRGIPMRDVMQVLLNSSLSENATDAMVMVVNNAYKEPKFATSRNQKETAVEFGSKQYRLCREARENK